MGLRVDAQGQPQSEPQVIIPSFATGESLSYARFGDRLVVAHRSTASINEVALHVFDDAGSELFVQQYPAPTGSLGGMLSLLGASSGDWLLLAHDFYVPGPSSWDPNQEGITLTRFVCDTSR